MRLSRNQLRLILGFKDQHANQTWALNAFHPADAYRTQGKSDQLDFSDAVLFLAADVARYEFGIRSTAPWLETVRSRVGEWFDSYDLHPGWNPLQNEIHPPVEEANRPVRTYIHVKDSAACYPFLFFVDHRPEFFAEEHWLVEPIPLFVRRPDFPALKIRISGEGPDVSGEERGDLLLDLWTLRAIVAGRIQIWNSNVRGAKRVRIG